MCDEETGELVYVIQSRGELVRSIVHIHPHIASFYRLSHQQGMVGFEPRPDRALRGKHSSVVLGWTKRKKGRERKRAEFVFPGVRVVGRSLLSDRDGWAPVILDAARTDVMGSEAVPSHV